MKPDGIPEPGLPLARPLTRRQLLQAGSFGALALFLGQACGTAPVPSPPGSASPLATPTASPTLPPTASPIPPLDEDQLRAAVAALPRAVTLAVPGGGSLKVADLQAAAAALAAPDGSVPSVQLNPVAALGYILAAADWSGVTGAVELGRFFPGLALPIVRLPLARLPDGGPTAVVAGALPAGLTVRAGAALLVVSRLADGTYLVAIDDPARPIDGHPRLELGIVSASALAPLLAIAGAQLDAGSGAVVLADGTGVALRVLTSDLAGQVASAAGVLFVDRVPLQPKGAKPALTVEPIVAGPDASVVSGAASVQRAKDGRVLALNAGGKAVGRAQYIGGTPAWNWLGKDGLDWTLRELANRIGWRVGTELQGGDFLNPAWRSIVVAQCNQITIDWGINWSEVEPEPGRFDYSIARSQLDYTASYGFRVRGHPVVDKGDAAWLAGLSKTALREALERHVSAVVGQFKGAVDEWVVVNEPYLLPYRPHDPFYAALGYEYIDLAFATARKADPSAVLIYNDTENHTADGLTTALTRETVRRLHKKGLIDMVGLQMHLDGSYPPDPADVIATMRSYGVPVCVTEFDIDLSTVEGTTAERFAVQARIAASTLGAIRDSGVCRSLTLWGLGDASSWLVVAIGKPRAAPTPYDDHLKPKPFYGALLKGLA